MKENGVNGEDYLVLLPVFTTESQPTVTFSTLYNCSATPSASFDHVYCLYELRKYVPPVIFNLADEIKALKIENNI